MVKCLRPTMEKSSSMSAHSHTQHTFTHRHTNNFSRAGRYLPYMIACSNSFLPVTAKMQHQHNLEINEGEIFCLLQNKMYVVEIVDVTQNT